MENRILKARGIADIFELVKEIGKKHFGLEQHGLMVGLSDLGSTDKAFVGAFYNLQANMIVINSRPLEKIKMTRPDLYNYYLFHLMLHEYVHALGSYDEGETRRLVYQVSKKIFGEEHIVTKFSQGLENFTDILTMPGMPETSEIEFVTGIDRENTDYIG